MTLRSFLILALTLLIAIIAMQFARDAYGLKALLFAFLPCLIVGWASGRLAARVDESAARAKRGEL